jgi:cytochrome b561
MTAQVLDAPSQAGTPGRERFDNIMLACHWLTLLLVLGLFAAALAMGGASDEASAGRLLMIHRSLGVTVWTLTVARLAWRLGRARLPEWPTTMNLPQRLAARVSEWGLYGLLLVQPLTGMAQSLYRGKPFDLFFVAHIGALVARDKAMVHFWHAVHEWSAWTLAVLIGAHALAALYHRFVQRDGVFQSMWPLGGRTGPVVG